MAEAKPLRLIVGLGNPGAAYDQTRHNVGFRVVKKYAEKHNMRFHNEPRLSGEMAHAVIGDQKVLLLLPATYMNSSGEAARLCVEYFKISLEHILVVSDDIYLPFGQLRLRFSGSAGGHNGLKSIEEHLRSQGYTRLRVGIGGADHPERAEYVLGKFTAEEAELLPKTLEAAVEIIEKWIGQAPEKKELIQER